MIPRADIVEWRGHVPWKSDAQVEQDLILSRLIVSLFQNPLLRGEVLFRGGTALHKLYLAPPVRYSEDLDFVQRKASPIGSVLTEIRAIADVLLGDARIRQKQDSVILSYRVDSEIPPIISLRVKIEINTREHFHAHPTVGKTYSIKSRWFTGESLAQTYSLEELLGTKLRALYQRKKGRDLFDLWHGLIAGKADPAKIVDAFERYLAAGQLKIAMRQMRRNLASKIKDKGFLADTGPLLRPGLAYSPQEAYELVDEVIVALLD